MQTDMKLILALFLCGVAYATASPTCSGSELDKCGIPSIDDEDYMATEEYLNLFCKSMGCFKDFKRRCGVESVLEYPKSVFEHSEKVYRAFCNTDSQELRRKYLDNIKCIYRQMNYYKDECSTGKMFEFEDIDKCRRIKDSLDCSNDLILRGCGKDAREVYDAASFGLEDFGCKK